MSTIITPHARYTFDEIKHRGSELLKDDDQHFAIAFTLAQQWLNGAGTFTFHTSGSTGTPKEINLKRSQLEASAQGTITALRLTSSEHILLCMNPAFIGGAMLLIRGLMLNAPITLQEPSGNPLQLVASDHLYTFASFTPIQLHSLVSGDAEAMQKLDRFNHILLGGAAVSPQLEQVLTTASAKVYHTYGMTETVSHIALKQMGKDTCFKALPGVELKTDERGCLAIRSGSTDHKWITTNDMVHFFDPGSFEILGRIDEVINTGGIKVWPAKIENAIQEAMQALGLQHNLFVSWQADERLGQKVIAVIEGLPLNDDMQKTIATFIEKKLTKYEMPRTFYYSPAFTLTDTGKINKPETLKMINLRP